LDEEEMLPTRPRRRKRERVIRSSTVRAMLAQAHFKFKQLLRYKLARVGGRLVDCEEKTSKPCSSCGTVNNAIGGDRVFRCSACHVRLDRDVNGGFPASDCVVGAKEIFVSRSRVRFVVGTVILDLSSRREQPRSDPWEILPSRTP